MQNIICEVSDAIELYTDFKFIQVTVLLLSQYYICSQENQWYYLSIYLIACNLHCIY